METNETLNETTADSSTADVMLSSSTISTFAGELAPQEAPIPEGEKKTEEQGATEVKAEEAKEIKEEKKEEVEDRFDKHPRFQELIAAKKSAESKAYQLERTLESLAREVNDLKARRETPEVPVDQEIEELFEVNPAKALQKVKELAKQEAKQEMFSELSERSSYTTLSTALKGFQEQNPDFTEMWESGELQTFADQNPLYNTPVAAYLHLSNEKKFNALKDTIATEVAKAVEAARKEERDAAEKRIKEVEANFKAKKETTVVTERASSPSAASNKTELETGGDKVSWLVKRAKAREASR